MPYQIIELLALAKEGERMIREIEILKQIEANRHLNFSFGQNYSKSL
jgi:hypothetical protein